MGLIQDRVVVVTGASRGAGKGIAVALGATGATVYVTGRSRREGDAPLPGTVQATAEAVTAAGGRGIAVYCDHADDAQVAQLFEQVRRGVWSPGYSGQQCHRVARCPDRYRALLGASRWHWQISWMWVCAATTPRAWFAAPLLLANGEGLVVNTSSFGGRIYMHGPAYGAGKAGMDKMAHDMAVDFRPHRVAVVALWMGLAGHRAHPPGICGGAREIRRYGSRRRNRRSSPVGLSMRWPGTRT